MAKLLRGKTSIKGLEQDLNDRVLIADIKDNYRYNWDCILQDIWMPKNG